MIDQFNKHFVSETPRFKSLLCRARKCRASSSPCCRCLWLAVGVLARRMRCRSPVWTWEWAWKSIAMHWQPHTVAEALSCWPTLLCLLRAGPRPSSPSVRPTLLFMHPHPSLHIRWALLSRRQAPARPTTGSARPAALVVHFAAEQQVEPHRAQHNGAACAAASCAGRDVRWGALPGGDKPGRRAGRV